MTPLQAEPRVIRSCAIFSVVDSFVMLRGVDGPGSARQVRGTVTFQLTAIGSGTGRRALGPAWTLPVIRGASGAFISYGTIVDPAGRRSRPMGPPLDLDIMVAGPAYRAAALTHPPAPAPGAPLPAAPAPPGPQLVNLDPSQPTVAVTPFTVQLWPGYGYPFPARPVGYSIVRGEVLSTPAGAGVDQAQVAITAAAGNWSDAYVTDSTGQWVFTVPDAQAGDVTIVASDAAGHSDQTKLTVTASTTIAAPALIPTDPANGASGHA
jgi:hypothetical protein